MEQIVRKDGEVYYGSRRCRDVDDAYCRFRDDYHVSLGKLAYYRLNRIGRRQERIHGKGFEFSHPVSFERHDGGACGTVAVRLLGIVATSYCRVVGGWDVPCETEEEFWEWFDWAFSRGSRSLRLVGRNEKAGRTSDRIKTRYR